MHLKYRNVNDAFRGLVSGVQDGSIPTTRSISRNGPVLRVVEPVIITYSHPNEHVLFNEVRDCNHASLLYESMWTLAGRRDVAPVAYYTPRMADYSDDGRTWHGAYGHRWRHHFGKDQLDAAVTALRADNSTRRVVLTMWDPKCDLLNPPTDARDLPCNTHAYVEVDDGRLNLTVCNRSNDMVWGALGANYVVFSFLLEYLAARVGVPVGVYHQFSANFHVYTETNSGFKPREWLSEYEPADNSLSWYRQGEWVPDRKVRTLVPLVEDPEAFEAELPDFVGAFNGEEEPWSCVSSYTEPFLQTVAGPLLTAFRHHKLKDPAAARAWAERVVADDWRLAAVAWLDRRARRVDK